MRDYTRVDADEIATFTTQESELTLSLSLTPGIVSSSSSVVPARFVAAVPCRADHQHFAINVLAVCDYLLAAGSPITAASEFSPPDVVYFSLYDRAFVKYTMQTANKVYVALAVVLLLLVATRFNWARWRALLVAFIGAPAGLISGMVGANAVAAIMSLVLGRGQSW